MELAYVTQIILAFAITSTIFAIMLFCMVCLPYQVTKPFWEKLPKTKCNKLKNREHELGSRMTFLNLHGTVPQDDGGFISDHEKDYHQLV